MSATPASTSPYLQAVRPRRTATRLPLDPFVAGPLLGLAAVSLLALSATTADDLPGHPHYFVHRQAAYFACGSLLAVLVSRIDYTRLRPLRYGVYAVLLASILLVMAAGTLARGSRRAVQVSFFSFQASELGKLLLIVALGAFVAAGARQLQRPRTTATIVALTLVPAALVVAQPDLGSGLVYVVIGLAVLYFAGTRWLHFVALGGLGAATVALVLVVAPAAGVTVLHDYQKARLTSFLERARDPGDQGYQQRQALIAVGSGRTNGRGDDATQTTLDFLPEHHTDFIFAVVGERWGFVGSTLVLALYALLLGRGFMIMTSATDLYGRIVAGGIVAMLLFQVFVNIGMTIGIMPITGIPLPLMSYGGSSAITTFLAVGLLQSIHRNTSRQRV